MSVVNFSGLASGIDSTALIKAQTDATRKQRITPLETKVTELQETNSKLEELRTKLSDFQSKSKAFTTLAGGGLAKTATSSNENALSATPSNAAANGIYSVTVTQKAKNAVLSFNDRFSSGSAPIKPSMNDAAPAADRTVTFTIGSGASASTVAIPMTSTTTPIELVNNFNASTTKATAALVNVGTSSTPSYAIVVTSGKEGITEGQLSVSVGNELTGGTAALATNTLDAATNATLSVSGIAGTITRSSNTVADLIPGVTLELQGTGTSTLTVKEDVSTTTTKVQEFVDSYNEIVELIKENNKIERQEEGANVKNVFGPLASTRTDDNALQSIKTALSSAINKDGGEIRIFADLGITSERDGTLKFDTKTFETAMAKEPSSVDKILRNFGDSAATTGGTIDTIIRFNGLLDLSVNSNKTQIDSHNTKIADAEVFIAKQEETMRLRFSRLESTVSKLQGQQSQLSSALAGLGR